MTATQLLIRWIAVAAFAIVSGLWQGKALDANFFGIVVLSATALTGLAALRPLTKRPGWSGFGIAWVRHFLVFGIIWRVIMGYSLRITAMASFVFATMLTIEAVPKRKRTVTP